MKIIWTKTQLSTGTEWSVELVRSEPPPVEDSEDALWARYRTACEAIREAPESAEAIARAVLDDGDE